MQTMLSICCLDWFAFCLLGLLLDIQKSRSFFQCERNESKVVETPSKSQKQGYLLFCLFFLKKRVHWVRSGSVLVEKPLAQSMRNMSIFFRQNWTTTPYFWLPAVQVRTFKSVQPSYHMGRMPPRTRRQNLGCHSSYIAQSWHNYSSSTENCLGIGKRICYTTHPGLASSIAVPSCAIPVSAFVNIRGSQQLS